MLAPLGGEVLPPHVAASEGEREFIDFYNRVRPFTRLNIRRARSLYDLAVRVCREDIPGNIVECGVAAGGSSMLLALVVQKHSRFPRKVFAFDTFTGMPDPEDVDTANGVPADDTGWGTGTCAAPEDFVREQCRRLGVGDIVQTRKGLFDASLPAHRHEIGEIALLHLDADWYSSTMAILDNLFDQLGDDALLQIDDYGAWDGCKKAILDYSARHDLFFDIHDIDGTGVWCAKPAQTGKKPVGKARAGAAGPVPASPPSPTRSGPGPAFPDPNAFLDPRLEPGFMDIYLVRTAILNRLDQAILSFSGTLLDVGCGQMPYREHILSRKPAVTRYVGLDFATGKYADRRQPDLTWDGTVIPLPDASVDCAMTTEVLEHCPEPLAVLREIRRVLVPGGSLFFTTPFLWPIHDAPHDHHRLTPFAMQRLLVEAGFEEVRVEAMGGWNAALAQMIGLWLRRAPMPDETRRQLTSDLFPFYEELARTDVVPDDFQRNPMITGLSGTAMAPRVRAAAPSGAAGELAVTAGSAAPAPRVIIVTDQFPVLSQTFILDQITGLMDRGLGVEHWSLQRMDEPVVHENVRRYGLLDRTRYITLPPDSLRGDPHEWAERFLRDNGISSPDDAASIQIHFGPNFRRLEPLFSVYPGLRVVVSFHGYDGSATFRVKGADVYAGLFARADVITTPSRFMKDTLVRYGCPPGKVVVHHYGKDTVEFAPAPRDGGRRTVRVLSVARFVEKKGLEYSLAAFAKAQAGLDAEYRIVGYGPLEPELRTLVASLGVADRVVFLGQLPNEEVRREMAEADIFALTSVTAANGDKEGVPVSLIEAQALGLPVVSSWHAGIPELVAHGETGFLAEERNVDEICGYLRVLLKNPAIRKSFAVNARNRVLREFDIVALNDALAGYLRGRVPARGGDGRTAEPSKAAQAGAVEEPNPEPEPGATVRCPICGGNTAFRAFGTPLRLEALCPECTSLERHRSLWLFLERYTSFFASPGLRMLHFAPEVCLERHFRKLLGDGYVTADLLDPRADVQADITALRFADASFDVVLCSHVLEHVPDDRKAMRELYRVLTGDGVAIVMVPLRGDATDEDLSVTDREERARRYGQSDHVRYYGMDIMDRLREAGFEVSHVDTGSLFSRAESARMRLGGVQLFLCRKPRDAATADAGCSTDAVAQPGQSGESGQSGQSGAPDGGTTAGRRGQALRATACHWSTPQGGARTRWWMHPAILRHCNGLVCGHPVDGPWAGLEERMRQLAPGGTFARGVSVGCGSASKELNLLERGLVGSFDLYEVSAERVAVGRDAARRRGVADRARFHVRDAFAHEPGESAGRCDLVYWNNALHHMFDVRQALEWSRNRLRPGGLLVVDDYVGATRFQWPDAQLDVASRVRRALPERLRRDPSRPDRLLPDRITRPDMAEMLATDPSEAADSDSIIPALRAVFPDVQIIPTGGVVYSLALKDAIANFDDTGDAELLRDLLDLDVRLAETGQTLYACAFAVRQAA
ncbi:TylF/MycF/NovP-related O-methyltransferase [Nitratidesulfovibrio sp. 1201_IL3209]|uniref:TylF/MycF/NovP-related O-methyltransferase n=1 Tax=Nitratidesulfovibrio sp. 1201_IL3209 TaxID=3084053 RepID=UPI002FDB0730